MFTNSDDYKLFDNKRNVWNSDYGSLVIIGIPYTHICDIIASQENWKETYFNLEKKSDFVPYTVYTVDCAGHGIEDKAVLFAKACPTAIIYAYEQWEHDYFYAYKGDGPYDNFTARFVNDTPMLSDNCKEDEDIDEEDLTYTVDVEITDTVSGYSFMVGGSMRYNFEKEFYERLVDNHSKISERRKIKEMSTANTRVLKLDMICIASYEGILNVPANLSREEAIQYAKEHMDDIKMEPDTLNWIADTDINEDECDFEYGVEDEDEEEDI